MTLAQSSGHTQAAEGDLRFQLVAHLVLCAALGDGARGEDPGGRHAVDVDVMGAHLAGQQAGVVDDPGLGDRIGATAAFDARLEPGLAADGDDLAGADGAS